MRVPLRLELGPPPETDVAGRTGRLDMAGLTLDEAPTLVQEGIPIKGDLGLGHFPGRRRAGGPLRGGRAGGPRGRKVGAGFLTTVGAYISVLRGQGWAAHRHHRSACLDEHDGLARSGGP